MVALVPIHQLPAGTVGRVREVAGHAGEVQRLAELGWRRGQRVEVVRSGAPCIVRLRAGRYCFRQTDSFQVWVAPEAD